MAEARKLLASIDGSHVVGLRDRAILAVLIYTASRRSAAAKLRVGDFYNTGPKRMLHFSEKGGKSREIPVRRDLEQIINEYIDAAGLRDAPKDTPLFQRAMKKQRRLFGKGLNGDEIYRMMEAKAEGFRSAPALLSATRRHLT